MNGTLDTDDYVVGEPDYVEGVTSRQEVKLKNCEHRRRPGRQMSICTVIFSVNI